MDKKKLQAIAKFYNIDKETAKKCYYFPHDIQYLIKHGETKKYNEKEWK